MMTTPTECYARADMLLLVGPIRGTAHDQLLQHLIGSGAKDRHARRIIWLCPGRDLLPLADTIAATPIGRELDDLPSWRALPPGTGLSVAADSAIAPIFAGGLASLAALGTFY